MSNSENNYLKELEIQKKVAYLAGTFYGDITLKTLIESMVIGFVMINEEGLIILMNNHMLKITGYDHKQVMGQPLSIIIPDNYHSNHTSHLKTFFRSPSIRPMGLQSELYAKRQNGSLFPVEISLSFLPTNEGKIGLAFVSDVSNAKEREKELKQQNEELDAYARTVAHDLSSPLSGIISLSDLLVENFETYSKEKQLKYLKEIKSASHKLNDVIKNLLIFASIRKESLVEKKIIMMPIIESVINRLNKPINDYQAKITIDESIHDCLGEESWIEEVWYNYIGNAIKYGGKPPVITISSKLKEDGFVEYFVSDNGAGLTKERQKEIFSTSDFKKSDLATGYGFGLNIVVRIIQKLNGSVNVKSAPGEGSTFSFSLKQSN